MVGSRGHTAVQSESLSTTASARSTERAHEKFSRTKRLPSAPIAQYPPLVPSQIQVSTQYIGASSDVVANTVTTPLEEQLNGAEGMIYMSSNSTNNGDAVITMTFEVGYDQSIAQMEQLIQLRSNLSTAIWPATQTSSYMGGAQESTV